MAAFSQENQLAIVMYQLTYMYNCC